MLNEIRRAVSRFERSDTDRKRRAAIVALRLACRRLIRQAERIVDPKPKVRLDRAKCPICSAKIAGAAKMGRHLWRRHGGCPCGVVGGPKRLVGHVVALAGRFEEHALMGALAKKERVR